MSQTETLTDQDLFMGAPLPDAELVIGQDFFDDPDPDDSSYRDTGDPLSLAVGTLGFMSNHIVQDCYFTASDGATTEPEEFDRFYFAPGDRPYEGPAPILIDTLIGDDAQRARERDDKHVEFKAKWCAEHNIRYVVLDEDDELAFTPEQLRRKLMGEHPAGDAAPTAAVATEQAKAKPERKRGAQALR